MSRRPFLYAACVCTWASLPALAADAANSPGRAVIESYKKTPLSFEANLGQTSKEVGFLGRGLGYDLTLEPARVTLRKSLSTGTPTVKISFLNGNPNAKAVGGQPVKTKIDYRIGSDPRKWLVDVPAYQQVRYSEVWPGIDVVYYGTHNQLEYDLIVHAGADVNAIRARFEGVQPVQLNATGDLVINTGAGVLKQRKPRIYQQHDGKLVDVAGQYRLEAGGTVRFEVGPYDKGQDLVIDPVMLYGEAADHNEISGSGAALDAYGNAFFTGTSLVQPSGSGPFVNYCYVLKLDVGGNQLANISFGGATQPTSCSAIAVDNSGNMYLTGNTSASDVFRPANGAQSSLGGGVDAFLVKFASNYSILYTSYIGGSGNDYGLGITADSAGNAYVVGQTQSVDFAHTTTSPLFPASFHAGGAPMGFAEKLNTAGSGTSSRVWSTLIGGSGSDIASAVALDGSGNVVISGSTTSADFVPTSSTGYNTAKTNGANNDGFIAVLNSAATAVPYFTFWLYGPISSVAVSGSTVYSTGQTDGGIVTTSNGYQLSGGANHAFVMKLNTATSGVNSLLYSSYLEGSGVDAGIGIAVGGGSNAYIVGTTTSTNFPQTSGAVSLPTGSSAPYAFLTILSTTSGPSTALVYSTLFGGNYSGGSGTPTSIATAVATDPYGNVGLLAESSAPTFLNGSGAGVYEIKFGKRASAIGIFRPSNNGLALDINHNLTFNGPTESSPDFVGGFGLPGDIIVTGDWNGSGTTKIGIFRPSSGLWVLDMNGDGVYDSGDVSGYFGAPNDIPVVGDWTGSGTTKIGIFRPSNAVWALDLNGNLSFDSGVDISQAYGSPGDIPVVGDWTGTGITRIGIFRPSAAVWALDINGNLRYDAGDIAVSFGLANDVPVVGDWDGTGRTKIGIFRSSIGAWALDVNGDYLYGAGDMAGTFGLPNDIPVVGDWIGSGKTQVGIFRPNNAVWALNFAGNLSYTPGIDRSNVYGVPGDVPIVGKWR